MDLLGQRVDADVEIIVVDGMSTDRTADIVRSFPEYGSKIRLLRNPRRLQVYAWNTALWEAKHEYFAMILAHADYNPDYFAQCLEVMRRTGADAVGGVQRPYGRGTIGRAVAYCMSSWFGVGDARFRYTRTEEESNTVFSIFTRCSTLRSLGGYDESLPFDEDSELNYRLRRSGGKIVVSPHIGVRYFVRESLRGLWKQMYCYGYLRRLTQLKHPRAVPKRIYAPPALLAALVLSLPLAISPLKAAAAVVPTAYAALVLLAALKSVFVIGIAAAAVPLALVTMHGAYGVGYWRALMTARRSLRGAAPLHIGAR
jgi:glycosyltransferase involved in cell wall biosynthesis